ncbi:MAG TPA: Swt1 family HEPN domain-containing protein [Flexilinea sp.]|nr:Swt1 family HEPN domain-containing protein [Flexilinea sp.]
MAVSNIENIGKGLNILKEGLAPYIRRELKEYYKGNWWTDGIERALQYNAGSNALSGNGSPDERFDLLDIQALLMIMWENWNEVFKTELGHTGRSYVSELREIRNKWAHQQPFDADETFRALDTMLLLLEMVNGSGQEELRGMQYEFMRKKFDAETKRELKKSTENLSNGVSAGLKPWREIVTPHHDVASGHYQQAEFAADLFQVISGKAEPEYLDPVEFFRRTYLTEGLSRLLSQAWIRLTSAGGDPVVELQTNFGGGKTHSMLALFHLFGGQIKPAQVPELEKLVPAGLKGGELDLPVASRAVLVGTQLSPSEVRTKADGTQVHTLWGEMAWQIGDANGKAHEAYELVAKEDQDGISPGSEKLAELFAQFGPVLVLIDEWVAYTRQLYGKENLPGGSFDSNITFVQALTEAAKAVPDTMVVAAIPESDIEIGGEGGKAALERIQNVFGRVESVWKPASSTESFEIVRRRLFQPISEADYASRDAVCRKFAEMYQVNRAEFPTECREMDYEKRMIATYPIHPELFDRLYEDWSTLERFQRTRGVLRMMAAVIYRLWDNRDNSLLIMPCTVPLDWMDVRSEITRYLPEGWGAVIDKDVDGPQSQPVKLDRENPNLGRYSACRRVARTIFFGSAPSASSKKIHGIEEVRIKLGCVQPGEQPSVFGDALRRLSEQLTYLSSESTRYWFDIRPTIKKIASDRAAQYEHKPEIVEDEITTRMKSSVRNDRGDFAGVHAFPKNSGDVPDEQACRLVILNPSSVQRKQSKESDAIHAAQDILENRGNIPRLYRNMLIFLAADGDRLPDLENAVRNWLAWTSILQDEEQLNLDSHQKREVENQIREYDNRINAQLSETFCFLLVPTQEGTDPVNWTIYRLQNGDQLVSRASKKLIMEQQLITDWAPALLRIELDRWLWKNENHIHIDKLWENLAQYLYLPRLRDEEVLIKTIRNGVNSTDWEEYFAYASGLKSDGTYLGLIAAEIPSVAIDHESLLVKPEVAKKQLEKTGKTRLGQGEYVNLAESSPNSVNDRLDFIGRSSNEGESEQGKKTFIHRFHATVELDPKRLGRDASNISEEVLTHLTSNVDTKATVTLEIDIDVPGGISEDKIQIIKENCNTLKFKTVDFE